jgi:hypothetical protein
MMTENIIPYFDTLEAFAKENEIDLTRACYRAELHPSSCQRAKRGLNYLSYPIAKKIMDAMVLLTQERGRHDGTV